jgi:hypothetical protein
MYMYASSITQMNVPRRAPIRLRRSLKKGMATGQFLKRDRRHTFSNDKGQDGIGRDTSDPRCPVLPRVGCEVTRLAHQGDEYGLGSEVGKQDTGDAETGNGEAVADTLHQRSSRA